MTNTLNVSEITLYRDTNQILDNVSFSVKSGTLVGIVGPNGAGKSTLLNVIAGLLPPTSGRVKINKQNSPPYDSLAYVPQREQLNWHFPLTSNEVVMLGRTAKIKWPRRPNKRDRDIVRNSLERVGMWDHRSRLLSKLSGGQKQRVLVARALAQEANVILLDEAFEGIDVGAQEYLVGVLRELRDDGIVVLMATHDLTNLADRFDQVLCLNRHVCAFGPPSEAFTPKVLQELYGSHGMEFTQNGSSA
jgi:ABC-type Mn2+/Zn2+ transport system ATPase subunit